MSNQITTVVDYIDAKHAVGVACSFGDHTRTAVELPVQSTADEVINRLKAFVKRLEDINAAQWRGQIG